MQPWLYKCFGSVKWKIYAAEINPVSFLWNYFGLREPKSSWCINVKSSTNKKYCTFK